MCLVFNQGASGNRAKLEQTPFFPMLNNFVLALRSSGGNVTARDGKNQAVQRRLYGLV